MVHALRGKEHVEWDNPYDVGMTGLIGFASGYYAMLDCDVLLMLGTDFPYRQFYPQGSARASRRSISGRNRSAAARRWTSASSATSARRSTPLLPLLEENRDRRHLDQATEHYRKTRKSLDELAVGTPGKRPIHPQQIAKAISDHAGRGCDLHLRRRSADGLGRALSGDERQAAAARVVLARLDGQCDGAGDRRAGGVSRPAGHLAVGRRRVRHADGRFPQPGAAGPAGEGRRLQQRRPRLHRARAEIHRLHRHRDGLQNPNFAAMAEAVGVRGIRIEDPGEVEEGIAAALAHDGPVLVDAVVSRTELAMPPAVTAEMAKGFTLYMVKAVMSGRGDELLDLGANQFVALTRGDRPANPQEGRRSVTILFVVHLCCRSWSAVMLTVPVRAEEDHRVKDRLGLVL